MSSTPKRRPHSVQAALPSAMIGGTSGTFAFFRFRQYPGQNSNEYHNNEKEKIFITAEIGPADRIDHHVWTLSANVLPGIPNTRLATKNFQSSKRQTTANQVAILPLGRSYNRQA